MNKYNAIKKIVDNIRFDSTREATRYTELKLLESAGEIRSLKLQPKYILQIGFTDSLGNKHQPIHYIADFSYYDKKGKITVVEDVKGMKTEVYRLKKKLFLYVYQDFLFQEI